MFRSDRTMTPPRHRRIACAASLPGALCVLLFASGCMTPPVAWHHDAQSAELQPTGEALLVLAVDDRRPAQNEDPSWLNWLPFVLWTTETDQVFEWQLLRNGVRRHAKPNPAIAFDAERDLQRAIAQQVGRSKRFGPVFVSKDESGPWRGEPPRQWTLQLCLDRLSLRTVHWRYGLGPIAPVAYLLGAPAREVWVEMDCELKLSDPAGKERHRLRVREKHRFRDGFYCRSDAEQRALDEISLVLGERLDDVLRDQNL